MTQTPPSIPTTISVVMRVETTKPTLADLERARDHEENKLYQRERELEDELDKVSSLKRQIANVRQSIDDLNERIEARSAVERVAFLENEVKRLKDTVSELRNPRDGREFG